MSLRYLLDTDVCVWVMRKREPTWSRLRSTRPGELALASMTEAELLLGALKGNSVANSAATESLIAEIGVVLPFDSQAARKHAELRYALRAQPIGERDLVIASTAIVNDLVLATGNVREFGRVPGLQVEDWIKP